MKSCAAYSLCWMLAVLAAGLVLPPLKGATAADERLYPHAERQSGPWGYIDKTGKVVIPLQFEWAAPFSEGLAAVRLGGKHGFVDRKGQLVIKPRFDWFRPFQSGRASVRVGKAWGFIDRSGAVIGSLRYRPTWSFSGDRAPVRVPGGKMGAVNLSGQMVIAPEFEVITRFSEGLAAARRGGKYGYIDKEGKVVIDFQFKQADAFQAGQAFVRDANGRSEYINKKGVVVSSKRVGEFSEGLAIFFDKSSKRHGVIDTDGNIVIPPRFLHIGLPPFADLADLENPRRHLMFSEGLLPVFEGTEYGYIDKQGRYVIQPQFRRASPFRGGLAVVQMDAHVGLGAAEAKGVRAGLIDRTGKFVAPPIYDWAKPKPGGLVQVKFGERLGYLDSKGRPLTFSERDIEEYLEQRREKLKPPPPGRAVIGKARDGEYYLHLPDNMCALDGSLPRDRKLLDDLLAKSGTAAGRAKKRLPQKRKTTTRESQDSGALKAGHGLIADCEELKRIRSDRNLTALRTYALAIAMRRERRDTSGNAGLVYLSGFLCPMLDKRGLKTLHSRDKRVRVWNAFKRLEAGEGTKLPALAWDGLACYSGVVSPASQQKGMPGPHAKAKVHFITLLLLPDWMVHILTEHPSVESPEAFLKELEREKTFVKALKDANFKK